MFRKMQWIREPFCSISHFVGVVLSVVGLIVLLIASAGRPWHTIGFSIYGASLIFLYTASTLYHTLNAPPRIKNALMKLDHIAIYLLIAGTYVPVCLVALRGGWGWTLFGIQYTLAAIGIIITLAWKDAPHWIRVVLYICMGWLALIAISPLVSVFTSQAMTWLVAGGLIYTVGAVIYSLDRPHLWPGRFSAHDLWHVFVLAGSICHFIFVLRFVTPVGT